MRKRTAGVVHHQPRGRQRPEPCPEPTTTTPAARVFADVDLRALRIRCGLSRLALAKRLRVSARVVADWEAGARDVPAGQWPRLLATLTAAAIEGEESRRQTAKASSD